MTNRKITSHKPVDPNLIARATSAIDPLPTQDPPVPPEGYTPTPLPRGTRPQRLQVAIAPKAAEELRAATSYAQQFSDAAPDAASVADALVTARAWSDHLQKAAAWHKYVQEQEHRAWTHALGLSDNLKDPFLFRQKRDPTVVERFPSLAQFLGAPAERAKRGASTRKNNKKKAAKAKGATPPPTQPTPPPAEIVVTDPVKTAAVKLLN